MRVRACDIEGSGPQTRCGAEGNVEFFVEARREDISAAVFPPAEGGEMEAVHTAPARGRFKSSRCVYQSISLLLLPAVPFVELLETLWSGTTSHAQLASLKKVVSCNDM